MLRKLIKYEFRATARVMLPLYLVTIVLALLTRGASLWLELATADMTMGESMLGFLAGLVAVAFFLVGCAYTCLSFYTPLAIGHSFAQHKMLLSVAFFFAIEVVVQMISGIALIAGLPALDNLFFWANTNLSPAGAIHGFMWGCIGYTAVFTVVLYCLTIRMLHRHLNLE